MARLHNFNAGPAVLPLPVLEEAQRSLIDYEGSGLSVLEMSHRSAAFAEIHGRAKRALAALLALPDGYEILFLQGGASLQFAMVPLSLGQGGAYVTTGVWSQKALAEARRVVGDAREIWTHEPNGFRDVPRPGEPLDVPEGAPYLHYTSNNTIYGTQWRHVPESPAPLVCDMSSDFLAYPIDVRRFGLIYAGAQKNAGPSGVTIVIGRADLLRTFRGPAHAPTMLRYDTHLKAGGLYNTPSTMGIWLCALTFEWLLAQGGLAELARRNAAKAARLYAAIDARPDVFAGHAAREARSEMNVTFRLSSPELEARFLAEAEAAGCVGLPGHRSVGGVRASIYNALPMESVEVLARLIEGFRP